MGVTAEGILRGYQGLFTPVSLGYPLSLFNKNSTLKHLVQELYLSFINKLIELDFPEMCNLMSVHVTALQHVGTHFLVAHIAKKIVSYTHVSRTHVTNSKIRES